MKSLVFSDSHGRMNNMETALELHPDAKHIFFLGDGEDDIDTLSILYPDKIFHSVSGNCDFLSRKKQFDVAVIEGIKIFFTHGHYMRDTSDLVTKAKEFGATVALSGHTHIACTNYIDGVYIMNPGSVSRPRDQFRASFGILDIRSNGILTSIARI